MLARARSSRLPAFKRVVLARGDINSPIQSRKNAGALGPMAQNSRRKIMKKMERLLAGERKRRPAGSRCLSRQSVEQFTDILSKNAQGTFRNCRRIDEKKRFNDKIEVMIKDQLNVLLRKICN